MIYLTEEVKAFVEANLGETIRIKEGIFGGEEAKVVGYTERDGLNMPSVIVEIDYDPFHEGWGEHELTAKDHLILDVNHPTSLWYVDMDDIEIIKEC